MNMALTSSLEHLCATLAYTKRRGVSHFLAAIDSLAEWGTSIPSRRRGVTWSSWEEYRGLHPYRYGYSRYVAEGFMLRVGRLEAAAVALGEQTVNK
jgi:hypothetical protein